MHASQGCNKEDVLLVFINFLLPGHLWIGVTVEGASQADEQTLCKELNFMLNIHLLYLLCGKGHRNKIYIKYQIGRAHV